MYRLILQDYSSHWRSGLKKMLDINGGSSFLWLSFCLTNISDDYSGRPAFWGISIPFLVTYYLSRMYGGYLNKTLFLCPLDKNTRQEYTAKSIRLRIIIPTALFLVINLTTLALGKISIIIFLLSLFIFSCMVMYLNMYCQPIIINPDTKEKCYPVLGNFQVLNGASHVCSYFNICFISSLSVTQKMPNIWIIIIFGFFVMLQFTLCIDMIRKFYKQILRETAFYN